MNAQAPESGAEIVQLAASIDVALTEAQAEALNSFAALLEKWNRAFNLLSRQDISRLWSRHILDALSINDLLSGQRVLDFGTGGGFPGLPLAIVNPEREFVLLDRHQRKCRFLEQVVRTLMLPNTTVVCGQVQEMAGSIGSFNTITSRAVAPAEEVWDKVNGLLQPGGRILAMAATGRQSSHIRASAGGGEKGAGGGEKSARGGEKNTRGGEKNTRGGERNARGGERNARGVPLEQLGGSPEDRGVYATRIEQRHIPGLEAPHEVVIIEAPGVS